MSIASTSDAGSTNGPNRRKQRSRCSSNSKFRNILSIISRGSKQSSTVCDEWIHEALHQETVIFRWTAACLNVSCPIFSKNPTFNMIFCPIPSLIMFVVIYFSSENAVSRHLMNLFELIDEDLEDQELNGPHLVSGLKEKIPTFATWCEKYFEFTSNPAKFHQIQRFPLLEIRKICKKVNALQDPKSFYCFVRFLVDEERTTTVSKELMSKSNALVKQQVFASIRPSRVLKYLTSLAFGNNANIQVPRPSLLTSNGYGSIGLIGSWVGRARALGPMRFATTYSKRKIERYFEIDTDYTRTYCDEFEVVEIPFVSADSAKTAGSFVLFRPFFVGHLSYANRRFNTEMMASVIKSLSLVQSTHGRLLLPQFHVEAHNDLWKNLVRHGVQTDLGQSQKLPPLASLWHCASLNVSADGLLQTSPKRAAAMQKGMTAECQRRRVPTEQLLKKSRPFAIRFDSPFTYMVMLNGLPVYTGSYFGNPPPKNSEIFVRAPERIRKKRYRPPKVKKRPLTRRQKLFIKIRKSEEADRKRDEKRKKKEEKQRKSRERADQKEQAGSDDNSAVPPNREIAVRTPNKFGFLRRMLKIFKK